MLNQLAGPRGLSRFSEVGDDTINSFIRSVPRSFSDAVGEISDHNPVATEIPQLIQQNRIELSSVALRFHGDAHTLTAAVNDEISSLANPETLILVSTHQPNLFAYGGIFKKIILLQTLKHAVSKLTGRKVVDVFLIVDHDYMDETWIRLAQLPSMDHAGGILELRHKLRESQRWTMVCNAPIPEKFALARWKSEVRTWIKSNTQPGDERVACLQRFAEMWREFELAYQKSRSYADLNSFFMSSIVNGRWGYGTLFVRLSQMAQVFKSGYGMLLSRHDVYSKAIRDAEQILVRHGIDTGVSSSSHLYSPLWAHCSCGSKASARFSMSDSNASLHGPCMGCKREVTVDLGPFEAMDLDRVAHLLSPRAIPIPILFASELGVACYASGTGGLGYLVDCSIAAKRLGVSLPVIALWSSKDNYTGIGQRRAMMISASCNKTSGSRENDVESEQRRHSALERDIKLLLSKRNEAISSENGGVPTTNFLAELFLLKERQRKIRANLSTLEKIRNATMISPCFVDYAVNFGIEPAEKFWKRHLFESGDLAQDIKFSHSLA